MNIKELLKIKTKPDPREYTDEGIIEDEDDCEDDDYDEDD